MPQLHWSRHALLHRSGDHLLVVNTVTEKPVVTQVVLHSADPAVPFIERLASIGSAEGPTSPPAPEAASVGITVARLTRFGVIHTEASCTCKLFEGPGHRVPLLANARLGVRTAQLLSAFPQSIKSFIEHARDVNARTITLRIGEPFGDPGWREWPQALQWLATTEPEYCPTTIAVHLEVLWPAQSSFGDAVSGEIIDVLCAYGLRNSLRVCFSIESSLEPNHNIRSQNLRDAVTQLASEGVLCTLEASAANHANLAEIAADWRQLSDGGTLRLSSRPLLIDEGLVADVDWLRGQADRLEALAHSLPWIQDVEPWTSILTYALTPIDVRSQWDVGAASAFLDDDGTCYASCQHRPFGHPPIPVSTWGSESGYARPAHAFDAINPLPGDSLDCESCALRSMCDHLALAALPYPLEPASARRVQAAMILECLVRKRILPAMLDVAVAQSVTSLATSERTVLRLPEVEARFDSRLPNTPHSEG